MSSHTNIPSNIEGNSAKQVLKSDAQPKVMASIHAVPVTDSYKSPVQAENFVETKLKIVKCNCIWSISDFTIFSQETKRFESPPFYSAITDKNKWCMNLWPKGFDGPNEENQDYMSIYLDLVSSDQTEVQAKFKFSILNDRREEIQSLSSSQFKRFEKGKNGFGYPQFINRGFLFDRANGLLPGDKLSIFCEVSVYVQRCTVNKTRAIQYKVPKCTLANDFGDLFSSEKFPDVILLVGERKFHLHKGVLASRSSVFSAMFQHDLEESNRNVIQISDIDEDVIEEMLRYLYTGKVNRIDEMAEGLLAAADKYDLERLKVICEETLYRNLSVENVVNTLILADLHNALYLKPNAINFLNFNIGGVMTTDGWKTLNSPPHLHLAVEAYQALAAHIASITEEDLQSVKQNT